MRRSEGPAAWRVAATVPDGLADACAQAFADIFTSVSAFEAEETGSWTVESFTGGKPDLAALSVRLALLARAFGVAEPPVALERLPERDWLAASYRAFPPIPIGRFVIHGSHVRNAVPPGAIGLMIDAATAFGTGEHPTTRGCLRAIERLAKRRRVRNALDMGCGTGILAMAIAKRWAAPVLAVDIDRESVRVARLNAQINRVADRVTAACGDGYRDPRIAQAGPYDLIAANILARPLAQMAKDLARHLAPGGAAILSGLLARQESQVLNAHRLQGLALVERVPESGWPTLILTRP